MFHPPETAMATHSSTLAWQIPWMEEPSRLQSMGSLRVRHDWAASLSFFTFVHWRRKWQPTPVFLPGESQGRGSLVGCCLWGRTELDTTEAMQQQQSSTFVCPCFFICWAQCEQQQCPKMYPGDLVVDKAEPGRYGYLVGMKPKRKLEQWNNRKSAETRW